MHYQRKTLAQMVMSGLKDGLRLKILSTDYTPVNRDLWKEAVKKYREDKAVKRRSA